MVKISRNYIKFNTKLNSPNMNAIHPASGASMSTSSAILGDASCIPSTGRCLDCINEYFTAEDATLV